VCHCGYTVKTDGEKIMVNQRKKPKSVQNLPEELQVIEADPELGEIERRLCEHDFLRFCSRWLWIVNKRRKLQRLQFNAVQQKYHADRSRFDIILKARKLGMTTYKCAEFFHETIFRPNTNTTIIAHNLDTTIEIFEKIKFFCENLPDFLRPRLKRNTERALVFLETPDGRPLNSKYVVGTAGNFRFGRGKDIDNLHLSEYAFYPRPEKIKLGTVQALRDDGKVCIESTANGFNDFHQEWQDALQKLSRFKPHFFPWFLDGSLKANLIAGEEFPLSPNERLIMQKHNLSLEQMMWRRQKALELKDKFPQEFPLNDSEAFLSSGRPVFDNQKLNERLLLLADKKPLEMSENGALKIWKHPQPRRRYVAGADTAEGIAGGDYSCMVILDREDCEQVAELHGHFPPAVFARKCADICRTYNNALLGVERNNHGHTVLNVLKNQIFYENLYYHKDYSATTKSRKLGWETNLRTKPIMIDDLAQTLNEELMIVHDPEFIRECLTYIYTDKGGTSAQSGCHDDRVMAWAITLQMRKEIGREVEFFFLPGV